MRIILNGYSTNDELELVDPVVELNTAYSLASYSMSSVIDASGNDRTLGGSTTFDNEGIVLAVNNNRISTGILETDEMTFVIGHNYASAGTAIGNILCNLIPTASPFSGIRLAINNGAASVAVGTGTATSASLSLGTVVGGWTVYAFSVSNTEIRFRRMNGTSGSLALPARSKSAQPFFLNGAPDGSQFAEGYAGKQGVLAAYNKAYTVAEMTGLIDSAKKTLQAKGIPIN
jgi:hypothetical protein